MILHIPHSSTHIPFIDGFIDNIQMIQHEIDLLTDWYTDELFDFEDAVTVKAEFSRIFCDVERFPDDKDEIMSKYGMGVCYTQTDDGKRLRDVSNELRKKILEMFYWKHHQKLDQAVEQELNEKGKALILDCHSFPDIPFKRDLIQGPNRPDINIGTDSFHTPKRLVEATINYFESKGYSVSIDEPYAGTIVPLKHYRKTREVASIMLEVNRKLYLEGYSTKNGNFDLMIPTITGYIENLKSIIEESDYGTEHAIDDYPIYKLEPLEIQSTNNTPYVSFKPDGNLLIKGRYIPEDIWVFSDRIIDWVNNYIEAPANHTILTLEFEYIIDASKYLLILIKKLEKHCPGFNVDWIYDENDTDMLVLGEILNDSCQTVFNFISK